MPKRKYIPIVSLILLIAIDVYLFSLDWKNSHLNFTFAALDIGQGDALFAQSPSGAQIMFDGGPVHKVLGPLRKIMSPFDHDIDAIVITNPDADHIGGFLDVLKSYKVHYVFESGTANDSKTYQNLEKEIKKQNIPDIIVRKGMKIDMGAGAEINFLFPDRDVSSWATNDGSVVARLTYGNASVMLTGDATMKTEKLILADFSNQELKSTVLKVGHHGSRTSTSPEFIKAVAPAYAVISDGKDNKYGHPHQETLNTLAEYGTRVLRTDLLGTIMLECDRMAVCTIKK